MKWNFYNGRERGEEKQMLKNQTRNNKTTKLGFLHAY